MFSIFGSYTSFTNWEGGPVRGLVRGRVRGRVVVQGAMAALTCNQSMATTAAANVARIAGKKHTQN